MMACQPNAGKICSLCWQPSWCSLTKLSFTVIAKIAATQVNRDMASFPIFKSLEVSSYGLYPGSDGTGLSVSFGSGLTLILGANGLGKSTLITILFRELTGPFDLALPSGSIGTAELKAFAMGPYARGALASRVNDAAKDAEATLTFELGRRLFVITRSLTTLLCVHFL